MTPCPMITPTGLRAPFYQTADHSPPLVPVEPSGHLADPTSQSWSAYPEPPNRSLPATRPVRRSQPANQPPDPSDRMRAWFMLALGVGLIVSGVALGGFVFFITFSEIPHSGPGAFRIHVELFLGILVLVSIPLIPGILTLVKSKPIRRLRASRKVR